MYTKQQLHNFRYHFFKTSNRRPFLRLTKAGQVKDLYTIHECAAFLNCGVEQVWEAFCQGVILNGYRVSHIGCCDKAIMDLKLNRFIRRTLKDHETEQTPRPIKAIDIIDNVTTCYSSICHAGRALGVTSVNVRHRISTKEKYSLVANRYIVLDVDTPTDFITDEVKANLLSRVHRQIVVYHQKEGTLTRYEGLADFIRQHDYEEKLHPIYYRLKRYNLFILKQDVYIMFDPKRGGQTPDKAMFKHFREAIQRYRNRTF